MDALLRKWLSIGVVIVLPSCFRSRLVVLASLEVLHRDDVPKSFESPRARFVPKHKISSNHGLNIPRPAAQGSQMKRPFLAETAPAGSAVFRVPRYA
jgi:hypothetical protein